METIKYEPIFGDQSLFDGAPENAVLSVHIKRFGVEHYSDIQAAIIMAFQLSSTEVLSVAMRRIIKTPVWTVADKKAGRLPEVGVLAVYHIAKGKTPTEMTSCWREGDELEIMKDLDEGLYSVFNKRTETCSNLVIDCINPIETPAEKAQRLEDEFINHVLHHEKSQINSSEELVAAKRAIKLAYKLQLSGELQSPKDLK